eukprot:15434466-Alexandrium_andersonii.AAC.1
MHPSRASGAKFEAASGPAQFDVRTPAAISACSIGVGSGTYTVTSPSGQPGLFLGSRAASW